MDSTTPDLEPVTARDMDPNKSILSPLYGPDIPMSDLPARLITDCDGTLEDAACHILGRKCVVTDWDVDLDSHMFSLYMVMPDGPKPPYIESMHLFVYGQMAELTASRAMPLPEPGDSDHVLNTLILNPGNVGGISSNVEVIMELDTALIRLTVTGIVSDLPRIGVMEAGLRRAEDMLKASLGNA